MNRIFLAFAACLLLSLSTAWATADGPDFFRVHGVSAGSLILRAAPGPTGTRLGAIPKNATGLRNLGCKGGMTAGEYQRAAPDERERARRSRWCMVEYGGKTGWVAGWLLAEGAPPANPSFDCAKASSGAEKLVCADADLARLDMELDRLYRLAADGADTKTLKAYQRGWIKGRDDCWKAGDGLRDCVIAEYAMRIHELRVTLAKAGRDDTTGISLGPFAYACDGMAAKLAAVFIRGRLSLASLHLGPDWMTLPQLISASGARYGDVATDGGKVTFWIKGADAHFQRGRRAAMACHTEPSY